MQRHKMSQIRACGGLAFVVQKENWDAVKNQLLKLSKGEFHDRIET